VITLITGAPGAGKTALLVEWLRTLYADRPLYVHGLNGLTLEHQPVDAAQWHTELPDGAVLVIDEVQQVWRPRGPGHAPPASVQALETHRHRGIDVFLTTQKPNLLDSNVRGLIGRHVHLRDTGWLGRWVYEWPECSENLAWKTCAIKRRYKLPKRAFDLYKSASLHTNAAKTKSMMPLITAGLVALAIVLAILVYRVVSRQAAPAAPAATPPVAVGTHTAEREPDPGKATALRSRWPVYEASPHKAEPDPYHGRAIQLEGQYVQGGEVTAYFGLIIDGERITTVSLKQLVSMGYSYTELGPCAALLRYQDRERLITCGKRVEPVERRPERPAVPGLAASAAVA
jgi:zona occludens toxin (predicted ATPase)